MTAAPSTLGFIRPTWAAPPQVKALMTTRLGGTSRGTYSGLNLGLHCGDDEVDATANRERLFREAQLPAKPIWLRQTHSTIAVLADHYQVGYEADASYTQTSGVVCAVMTADCLPLLITNQTGTEVAAIHAGWTGMADGIIESTIQSLSSQPNELFIWFGAAIGPEAFEVGEEVIERFAQHDPHAEKAFVARPGIPGKWLGDLYQLARHRCIAMGVPEENVSGGELCTHSDAERFYSYRRDRQTGRMASLIWIV